VYFPASADITGYHAHLHTHSSKTRAHRHTQNLHMPVGFQHYSCLTK